MAICFNKRNEIWQLVDTIRSNIYWSTVWIYLPSSCTYWKMRSLGKFFFYWKVAGQECAFLKSQRTLIFSRLPSLIICSLFTIPLLSVGTSLCLHAWKISVKTIRSWMTGNSVKNNSRLPKRKIIWSSLFLWFKVFCNIFQILSNRKMLWTHGFTVSASNTVTGFTGLFCNLHVICSVDCPSFCFRLPLIAII